LRRLTLLSLPALLTFCAFGQDRLPREIQGTHVFAVVPIIGSGTADDPRRPMFVPLLKEIQAVAQRQDGVVPLPVLVQFQLSDDGKTALVEFMSHDRTVLLPILMSTAAGVKAFEKGVALMADIEAEFKKNKQSFTLDSMTPARFLNVAAIKAAAGAAQ
jgi:hypothetical protein